MVSSGTRVASSSGIGNIRDADVLTSTVVSVSSIAQRASVVRAGLKDKKMMEDGPTRTLQNDSNEAL